MRTLTFTMASINSGSNFFIWLLNKESKKIKYIFLFNKFVKSLFISTKYYKLIITKFIEYIKKSISLSLVAYPRVYE
jgi:hypothetical protein